MRKCKLLSISHIFSAVTNQKKTNVGHFSGRTRFHGNFLGEYKM